MPVRGESTRRAEKAREAQREQALQVRPAALFDLQRLIDNRARNLWDHKRWLNVHERGLGPSRKSREKRKQ